MMRYLSLRACAAVEKDCCRPIAFRRNLPARRWRRPWRAARSRAIPRPLCWSTRTACDRPCCGNGAGHTLDSANDKAYTAASFKTDTSALFERSKTVPGFANLFTQLPHLMLLGGGIVIKVGDEVVGAIGAAGAPGAN